jgi:hypothetical protein
VKRLGKGRTPAPTPHTHSHTRLHRDRAAPPARRSRYSGSSSGISPGRRGGPRLALMLPPIRRNGAGRGTPPVRRIASPESSRATEFTRTHLQRRPGAAVAALKGGRRASGFARAGGPREAEGSHGKTRSGTGTVHFLRTQRWSFQRSTYSESGSVVSFQEMPRPPTPQAFSHGPQGMQAQLRHRKFVGDVRATRERSSCVSCAGAATTAGSVGWRSGLRRRWRQ